jgi:GntR family transcriptional repressor for pyruvate dehydrogenase complex
MATRTQPVERGGALLASRLSRAEALARELEEEISDGTLGSGDRLGTKEDLRQRFGVANATVNEAVRLLETRGMVDARPGPGGGVFVADPRARMRQGPLIMGFEWSEATVDDYHEVRGALEPLLCRQAARNHRPGDVEALRLVLGKMRESLDRPPVYVRYHTAFHRRLARLSRNAPLRSLYVTLLDFFEHAFEFEDLPASIHLDNAEVHRQLLEAISQGEGPALEAAIRRHDRNRETLGMFKGPAGSAPKVPARAGAGRGRAVRSADRARSRRGRGG